MLSLYFSGVPSSPFVAYFVRKISRSERELSQALKYLNIFCSESLCLQNLKFEKFLSPFGRLRHKITCTCSAIIFCHSTNDGSDL